MAAALIGCALTATGLAFSSAVADAGAITPLEGPVAGGNSVTITADLADFDGRYVSVDHIGFDGQEYIDTGVVQINNGDGQPQAWVDFQYVGLDGDQYGIVFGARAADGSVRVVFNSNAVDERFHWQWGNASTAIGPTLSSADRFQLSTAGATATLTDGAQSWTLTSSGSQGTTPETVYVGAVNAGGSPETTSMFVGLIFGFRFDKAGIPFFDGIPAYDLVTGTYGLYDTVSGSFFGNQSGVGAITGPAVGYAVLVGGNPCQPVTFTAANTLTCTVPASTLPGDGAGPVDVTVTRDATTILTLAGAYDYVAPTPPGVLTVVKRAWAGVPPGATYDEIVDDQLTGVRELSSGTVVLADQPITWTYTVTYATEQADAAGLTDVAITDSDLGPVCVLPALAANQPDGCLLTDRADPARSANSW